jgi:hypothetical protein
MIGAIRAPLPAERPDLARTATAPAVLHHDDEPGGWEQERRQARRGRVLLVAAGLAAAAAVVAVAVVLPADGDGGGRVETDIPPAGEDDPGTTTTGDPTSSSTTEPPTTTIGGAPETTGPGAGTDPGDLPMGTPLEGFVPSGEVRRAELRYPLADQDGLDVPLDRLGRVAEVVAVNGSPEVWAADDGEEIALEIRADWLIGFGSGIEGTPRQLQTHWMVSAVEAQFIVWGVVPSDVRSVSVFLTDGGFETTGTVPVGSPEMASRVFAVILPQGAFIEGVAGERADGSVALAGTHMEESLEQFTMHHPNRMEWTGFIPVVQH